MIPDPAPLSLALRMFSVLVAALPLGLGGRENMRGGKLVLLLVACGLTYNARGNDVPLMPQLANLREA